MADSSKRASKPRGVYSKGPGVSSINPDAKGSNAQKYKDAVQTLRETAETKKDVADTVGMISAAGRKYKQDSTKDIESWKKFVKEVTPDDVPASWKTKPTNGSQAGHTVTKVDRKTGKSK